MNLHALQRKANVLEYIDKKKFTISFGREYCGDLYTEAYRNLRLDGYYFYPGKSSDVSCCSKYCEEMCVSNDVLMLVCTFSFQHTCEASVRR